VRIAIALFVSILLCACGGKEFLRPQSGAFTPGSTTYSQVVATYGEPQRIATAAFNSVPARVASYTYAKAIPFTTQLSTKSMVLIFDGDVMVSYDYASSFEDDKGSTAIDDEKVKQVSKGDKKSKVLSLLGRPGGEAIFPIVTPRGASLLRYTSLETYRVPFLPTPRITRKAISFKFDVADELVDVSSFESKPE
jgi:hypothetical protein